jgi:uncharacterized protein (TIGR00159 family)
MPIPWLDNVVVGWRDVVDILLVTILLYRIILFVQGTRAGAAIHGLFLLIVFYFIIRPLELNTFTWILENFLGSLVLIVIIVFQRDIRMALTYMGSRSNFLASLFSRKNRYGEVIEEVTAAAMYMAQRRIGALIVFEGNVPLGDMIQGGVPINAKVTKELLITIFWNGSPLHDGAVVLRNGQISAAGCILPLTTLVQGKQDYGTRHRAAIGITEETDSVVVVVSEERGIACVAIKGKLSADLDASRLRRVLADAMESHT